MAKKPSPPPTSRFTGPAGKANLISCLSGSRLLNGNSQAAQAIVQQGEVVSFSSGQFLLSQGAQDDSVLFLVSGSVEVQVNGRKIAVREACTHLGEMSAMDPTSRRSASVIAINETVCLALSAECFNSIAKDHPGIYRRIAVEMSTRLRQRNIFHKLPNASPVIFIGSSSEGLVTARRIHAALQSKTLIVQLWSTDVFSVSDTAIESLEHAAAEVDFAVLVLTPDDVTTSRKSRKPSPRDNVVYELGLFGGALGRKRTFMVVDATAKQKIPTDLLGVTALTFRGKNGITPSSLVGLKNSILAAIAGLGVR